MITDILLDFAKTKILSAIFLGKKIITWKFQFLRHGIQTEWNV